MQNGFKTEVLKPFQAIYSQKLKSLFLQARWPVGKQQRLVAAASTAATTTGTSAASTAATVRAAETAVAAATGRTTATAAAISTAAATASTATIAATAGAIATTAAAISTAAAEATGAWRTCLHRTGFVHHHATATQRLTVHAVDGCLCFCIAGHFDKAKALGATGVAFHHDFGAGHSAELTKRLLQVFVTHRVRQVADV